jgi:cell division protein FtsQ
VLILVRMPVLPVKELTVLSPLKEVNVAQLEYAAQTAVRGNMLTVDIENLRASIEQLPWVRRADLRRRWPDGLELRIEEHVPAALWRELGGEKQEKRLVNTFGEVFAGESTAVLPQLAGPQGSSREVLQRYREVAEAMGRYSLAPRSVTLSPRLAWQVKLDDGTLVELGRDQEPSPPGSNGENKASEDKSLARRPTAERLARFIEVYPQVFDTIQADVVDLRYPNGFALRNARERRAGDGKGSRG